MGLRAVWWHWNQAVIGEVPLLLVVGRGDNVNGAVAFFFRKFVRACFFFLGLGAWFQMGLGVIRRLG